MGYDQGNVPLRLLVFVLLTAAAVAQPPSRTRCGFLDHAEADARRAATEQVQALVRPSLPLFLDSPSGRFRVHYTNSGLDASTDAYVAACIDALEHAWRTEVDTLGFAPPPDDGTDGGSTAIDVYLRDLSKAGPGGGSYYGVTRLDRRIANSPVARFTTWIEIDNDFSPYDRDASDRPSFATYGEDALRATCAHEFHHSIQNGAYGLASSQLMFYELTSTWMELRVYPHIRDWAVYTSALLTMPSQYPMSRTDQFNGYMWGWFGNVLDPAGPAILRRSWERIADAAPPFAALAASCTEAGVTLSGLFTTNLPALYLTGTRGANNTVIPGADLLPEIALYEDLRAEAPTTISVGSLNPFEVRAIRISVPSLSGREPVSTTVVLTWPEEQMFVNGAWANEQAYTVRVSPDPVSGDVLIPGTSWGLRIEPSQIYAMVDGTQTKKPQAPYPQPVRLAESTIVNIPAEASLGSTVTFTLMSTTMTGLVRETVPMVLDGDRVVARCQLPADLPPGTYLVRVETGTETTMHKIAVRR